ncbi:hypothetical protein B0H66DRAFT_545407 [Apodospora peruviana]|uniref:Uncharacterized protein n=1 Tax=Apodospora peruviana TaxID=516989 RepID=A0AAE0ITQ8_9PEZI|nr:hypothetical protein B0H66DRAFT_545407 [Apodospora peruviana]
MPLTPLKVKGKGPRPKPWAPPDPARFKRRKRENLNEDDMKEATDAASQGSKRRRRLKTKPAALIEQLPTEILERIFILSANLNFPRSSLRLGLFLSHKSCLSELIVAVFSPTWELWFGCPRRAISSYHGFIDDRDQFGGDPDFQTAILACRWINLSLVLEAQQVWYRRHGKGRPFGRVDTWYPALEDDLDESEQARLDHLVELGPRGPGLCESVDSFGDTVDTTCCFATDWEQLESQRIRFHDKYSGYYPFRCFFLPGYWDVHPLTRIPNHFLTGPYDWDKAKWLFWFFRAGAAVIPEYQTWELTKLGYERIMLLEDHHLAYRLVQLFSLLNVFRHWPYFLRDEKLDEALSHRHRPVGVRMQYRPGNFSNAETPEAHVWGLAAACMAHREPGDSKVDMMLRANAATRTGLPLMEALLADLA